MELKIFAGDSGLFLANGICQELNMFLGDVYLHTFPSGEKYCQFNENIRGTDLFLVQSICEPANDNLMQLLVMVDAARRASAGRITVVTPYLGYLRQDRKDKPRVPISAKLVANMITAAGADRVLGMDFHCEQAQGFFDIPVDHLYAMPVFAEYLMKEDLFFKPNKTVIVSPDAGGIKRAEAFSRTIGSEFAFIAKKRLSDTEVKVHGIVGDVCGMHAIILDDMTESCGTLVEAAKACMAAGAFTCRAIVSHGLLNQAAHDRLSTDQNLAQLIMTNSVLNVGIAGKTKILSVAPLFAKAIQSIHNNKSISDLFTVKGF
jgi:ribose-phosphate pyrophosphokinase